MTRFVPETRREEPPDPVFRGSTYIGTIPLTTVLKLPVVNELPADQVEVTTVALLVYRTLA